MLQIETFCLGQWQTNCYVVSVAGRAGCWLVDSGFGPGPMIEYVRSQGLSPAAVVMTHAHVDHMAGLGEVRQAWAAVPIWIHAAERDFLTDPMKNLSAMSGLSITAPPADDTLEHGQMLELEGQAFEVRHTPGHSPGGITLYHAGADVAIVGDALFAGSIGRYDFPTSNGEQLLAAIRQQLMTLPDQTRVLSGHGPETTIGRERAMNPYVGEQAV